MLSFGIAESRTPDFDVDSLIASASDLNVLIVANLGGWGRVPVEATRDLFPVLCEIGSFLRARGLKVGHVVFRRGGTGLRADLSVLSEAFGFHHVWARKLAYDLCRLREAQPKLSLLLVGLSNGATFVDQVMDQFKPGDDYRIHAIEIAPPFWRTTLDRPNMLRLDNDGRDPLPAGELGILLGASVAGLWRYSVERAAGRTPRFEEVFHVPGHDYSWPEIGDEVTAFLKRQLPGLP